MLQLTFREDRTIWQMPQKQPFEDRPAPLGAVLHQSLALDYDLVQQVHDKVNQMEILHGIYSPTFVGDCSMQQPPTLQ